LKVGASVFIFQICDLDNTFYSRVQYISDF
jgi:hypothetical protein